MGRKKSKLRITEEVLEEAAVVDPNDPLFKEFVGGGAPTQAPTEKRKREKEKRIKISFELPVSINDAIEEVLSRRVIKISKSKWMAQAFLQRLKIKDPV